MTTLLHIRGIAHQVTKTLVGKVTRFSEKLDQDHLWLQEAVGAVPFQPCLGVLTTQQAIAEDAYAGPTVYRLPSLDHLQEGDFVAVNPEGHVNTLYRVGSRHNTLLLTERCNSNCLMCSQPPKDRDDTGYFYEIYQRLIPMLPKDCGELGITGGEPTLLGDRFFGLLKLLQSELSGTELHILSNGRRFSDPAFTERYASLQYRRSMLGIPLYADYFAVHDHVVQAQGAFHQTVKGLYHLARHGQRIEIRVVLHQLTVPRLPRLAEYIYKNLPFVEHVAFMGLENTGYTPFHFNQLWIDPIHYQEPLEEAVLYLAHRGLSVSVYNAQLCVLPKSLWPFMRKSISDWKNIYLEECGRCTKLESCGGLFASSATKGRSAYLKAFG